MGKRLAGKVAVVTGAGGGIGREAALLFAAEGACVVVNDLGTRETANAASVVAEIEAAGGKAVANVESAVWNHGGAIIDHALDAFGRIDILINNATAGSGPANIWEVTEADWEKTLEVNLKGYFAMIAKATPHFARQRSGAIVNMSSGAGFGHPALIAYASAKEGVIGLTRSVAREIGRFGIRCNAIRPLALAASSEEYEQVAAKWMKLIQLSTAVTEKGVSEAFRVSPQTHPPAKIAPMIVWLCSDAANEVNGRTFHVRGDTIALLAEPMHEAKATHEGGWTLDALDEGASAFAGELTNAFRFDEHPDLQRF